MKPIEEMDRDELVEAYRAAGFPQPEEMASIHLQLRALGRAV